MGFNKIFCISYSVTPWNTPLLCFYISLFLYKCFACCLLHVVSCFAYFCFMLGSCLAYSSPLNVDATRSSEMWFDFRRTIRSYIPEDRILLNLCISSNCIFRRSIYIPTHMLKYYNSDSLTATKFKPHICAVILTCNIVTYRQISRQRPKDAHATIGYCKKCFLCRPHLAHC
jgi:hypothetical protein